MVLLGEGKKRYAYYLEEIASFNSLRTIDENRGLQILIEHVDGFFTIDQLIDRLEKDRERERKIYSKL